MLDHLDDADWLTTRSVAECMIATMQERGGAAWTPEMTAAWTEALGAVAGLMLAGYPEESVAV